MAVLWWPCLGLRQCILTKRVRWIVTLIMTRGILGMVVGAAAYPAYMQQDLLVTSVPMMDVGITVPVGNIPMTGNVTPVVADPWTACATGFAMPVSYEGDFADSDYDTPGDNDYATADPRNNFETVNGMSVYYGGDLNDSDYESPADNDYDTWEDWCDWFLPDDEASQLPAIFGASVFWGEDMGELQRARLDSWSASGSVVNTHPDPVVSVLSPKTVWGNEIVLHQSKEKCQTNASSDSGEIANS